MWWLEYTLKSMFNVAGLCRTISRTSCPSCVPARNTRAFRPSRILPGIWCCRGCALVSLTSGNTAAVTPVLCWHVERRLLCVSIFSWFLLKPCQNVSHMFSDFVKQRTGTSPFLCDSELSWRHATLSSWWGGVGGRGVAACFYLSLARLWVLAVALTAFLPFRYQADSLSSPSRSCLQSVVNPVKELLGLLEFWVNFGGQPLGGEDG